MLTLCKESRAHTDTGMLQGPAAHVIGKPGASWQSPCRGWLAAAAQHCTEGGPEPTQLLRSSKPQNLSPGAAQRARFASVVSPWHSWAALGLLLPNANVALTSTMLGSGLCIYPTARHAKKSSVLKTTAERLGPDSMA